MVAFCRKRQLGESFRLGSPPASFAKEPLGVRHLCPSGVEWFILRGPQKTRPKRGDTLSGFLINLSAMEKLCSSAAST